MKDTKKIAIVSVIGIVIVISVIFIFLLIFGFFETKEDETAGYDSAEETSTAQWLCEPNIGYYDRTSNQGGMSSFFNGRIYYYSNEQEGINGIYRMNTDGRNSEMLIECPDVRRIAVFDNEIYYVGLDKIYSEKSSGDNARYSVFKSSDLISSENVTPGVNFVYNAYFFEGNNFFVHYMQQGAHTGIGDLYYYENGKRKNLAIEDIKQYIVDLGEQAIMPLNCKEFLHIPVIFFGYHAEEDGSGAVNMANDTAFDIVTGDRAFDTIGGTSYEMRYYAEENEALVYESNELYFIDLEEYSLNNALIVDLPLDMFEDIHYYPYVFGISDTIVYEQIEIKQGLAFLQKYVLVINRDNGSYNILLSFDNIIDSVLYFDGDKLIAYQNREIIIYKHDGEKITDTKKLADIDESSITVSTSGDWMFVYSGTRLGSIHRLIYRINIETGEAIENTVLFDSSQHDEIHVDEDAPDYDGNH